MSEIKGGLPRWRLQRVLEFIEEHLNDDVSLSELSEAAGNLSRYHFARLFKQFTGYSLYQYFTRRRIRRARESQAPLTLTVNSRDAVSATLTRAVAAGGRADPNPAQDHGFMFGRSVIHSRENFTVVLNPVRDGQNRLG